MKISYPIKNIIHFQFDSQYEACSSFIRIQEFYESPYKSINGKVFSLDKFMDVYAKENGDFTYFQDWSGFNVPGHIVIKFFLKYWNQLRDKEIAILNKIPLKMLCSQKFYIIGTYDVKTVEHELAHALYYLNDDYAIEMNLLIASLPEKIQQKKRNDLLEMGYGEFVILDEMQAYWGETRKKFKEVFKRYINESK